MIDWSADKVARLTELVSSPEKYSESEMAGILAKEYNSTDFTRDAVHNKILRLDLRTLVSKPKADPMPYYAKYKHLIEGDERLVKSFALDSERPYVIELCQPKLKLLYLGDPHIPFQIDEQIQQAVNTHRTADVVITNEVIDCYSISRFNKKFNIPLEHEIDYCLRYFEYLSDSFPLVIVFSGNHDARAQRELARSMNPALLFLAQQEILEALTRPFENIVYVSAPFVQVNDAVFVHAEMFSKLDMRAVANVYAFIREWKESLRLEDIRLVVQSHTHMLGSTYRGGSFKLMESGCLCRVPDYAVAGFYPKPQTNGYINITQFEGVTDFNLTREHVFPTQHYIPNWSPLK